MGRETLGGNSLKQGKIEDEIHVPEEDGYAQNLVHLCHYGIMGCIFCQMIMTLVSDDMASGICSYLLKHVFQEVENMNEKNSTKVFKNKVKESNFLSKKRQFVLSINE